MGIQQDIDDLLTLSRQLLQAIDDGDWEIYRQLCDDELTAFEPEAAGHLVEGMQFHRYYFELDGNAPLQSTISSPSVRVWGDIGLVTYVRLIQTVDSAGAPHTAAAEETRVWRRHDGGWRHVHFHRSNN